MTLSVESLIAFWSDICPLTSERVEITERAHIGDALYVECVLDDLFGGAA